jgi:hypothetical protein
LGRAIQALGLLVMLGAVVWGVQSDDLGTELLVALVGFGLVLTGRSMQGKGGGPR